MLMPVDYAQISSTEDQRPTVTTPVQVTLNQNDSISGVEHSAEQPRYHPNSGSWNLCANSSTTSWTNIR